MVVKEPTHRQRQAQATREQIARAARGLFAERGYVGTTIAAISEAARIPEQTIYSALGNKLAILGEIARIWIAEADTRRLHDEALTIGDPAERLRRAAHWQRRQFDTGYDVITIYLEAARADARMAEEQRRVWAMRERELEGFVESIADHLADGPERALDKFLACTVPEIYKTLVMERGWSADDYEHWLAGVLIGQLLHR